MPRSPYKVHTNNTWRETVDELSNTLYQWGGVSDFVAEPNVPIARVHSRNLYGSELSVTVRFMKGDREVVLQSSSQDTPVKNLKLIQLCIDDMRMIERRGMDQLMRSAYLQLEGPRVRDPYEVLAVRPGAPREVVEASYRALARTKHPDAGGTAAEMAELNEALDAIKQREGW